MKNKKTVLIELSYLVDIDNEEIEEDQGLLNEIINKISQKINIKTNDGKTVALEWENTSHVVLDPDTMNCGRCANCNRWTTDIEKEKSLKQLCYGAIVDDKLLCDECLPYEHPCAF